MKKEFNIDLLNSKDLGLAFGSNHYLIIINDDMQRVIKINAQTGELISDETSQYEK